MSVTLHNVASADGDGISVVEPTIDRHEPGGDGGRYRGLVNLTRRRLLALFAGSIGLKPIVAASRDAIGSSRPPILPAPTNLEVIGREGWSSRPQGRFRRHRIDRITIHHTATEITDNSRAPALIRRHQTWHMQQGWPDLAYHFVIDRDGNIYQGRPLDAAGDTFTEYDPTGHLLPCFEGQFERQDPSRAQLTAMTLLVAWAMQTYSLSASRLGGHRDWAGTTCPGRHMYWRLGGLARAATDQGPVALSYLRQDEARDRVASIAAGR